MARHDMDGDEAMLDAFLSAARSHPPHPTEAFLARVEADAVAAAAQMTPPRRSTGWGLNVLISGLARWAGPGGLVAASFAGLWIGYAGIGGLGTAAEYIWSPDSGTMVDLLQGPDLFLSLDTGGQ